MPPPPTTPIHSLFMDLNTDSFSASPHRSGILPGGQYSVHCILLYANFLRRWTSRKKNDKHKVAWYYRSYVGFTSPYAIRLSQCHRSYLRDVSVKFWKDWNEKGCEVIECNSRRI